MAANLYNLIELGCSILNDSVSASFENKIKIIAAHFSTLSRFKKTSIKSFNEIKTIEGDRAFRKLTLKEENVIKSLQKELDLNYSVEQNFIKILTKSFINTQLNNVSSLSLETLNANPILCTALNFQSPKEFIKFYTYQSCGRSIVTSMGFLIQKLLLYSSENVNEGFKVKGGKGKWDLVIDRMGEVKTFLEIKSGFNDMDKAQVQYYNDEIELVERLGFKGFVGFAYGKKTDDTITRAHLKKYLKDWEDKTLVGKELWDFVSENDNYHSLLIETIDTVAKSAFKNKSIVRKIDEKIKELIIEFDKNFKDLKEYYESLW